MGPPHAICKGRTILGDVEPMDAVIYERGVNRTGLETEVIVKEKCEELIQCQTI